MADAYRYFAIGTVATPPSPATTGTSLALAPGHGLRLGTPPFLASIGPAPPTQHTKDNSERVWVTAISTDTLTLVREAEGSTARSVIAGDVLYAGPPIEPYLDDDLPDGKYSALELELGVANEALEFGDVVCKGGAFGKWSLTDADDDDISGPIEIGIVVQAASGADEPTLIMRRGRIRADAKFPTFVIGAPAYISLTPGEVVTALTGFGTDDVVRIVGHGHRANVLDFSPSNDWLTLE